MSSPFTPGSASTSGIASEAAPIHELTYLDSDNELPGQKYVCLSFISPEEIIKAKQVYFFEQYLSNFSQSLNQMFTNLKAKYPAEASVFNAVKETHTQFFDASSIQDDFKFYTESNSKTLESEYFKNNSFQTSIRGIKIRGSYDTFDEAKNRAQTLKRMGDKFNIYVGTVGNWIPWSPNPDDIPNQEFGDSTLNELMKRYTENAQQRDVVYEQRKRDKISTAKVATDELKASFIENDVWLDNMRDKLKVSQSQQQQAAITESSDEVTEVTTATEVTEVTTATEVTEVTTATEAITATEATV